MELNCICDNGTASDGNPCSICGGDGKISLTDEAFKDYPRMRSLHGIVWDTMLARLSDMEDKIDDVMDKCDDIKEKIDEMGGNHGG